MLMKIYALAWLLLVAASGVLLAMFGTTQVVLTVLGLSISTLFFAGIVAVLPWQMDKHYSRHMSAEPRPHTRKRRKNKESKTARASSVMPAAAAI